MSEVRGKKGRTKWFIIGGLALLFAMMSCAVWIGTTVKIEGTEAERVEANALGFAGFDSIREWERVQCGKVGFIDNWFKDYWDDRSSAWFGEDGFTSGKLDDLPSGWIRKVEEDGVVDKSDFPAKYRFIAKSKGNLNGDRHWKQHERFYNYDCSFYGNKVSDVDFTKVSMP